MLQFWSDWYFCLSLCLCVNDTRQRHLSLLHDQCKHYSLYYSSCLYNRLPRLINSIELAARLNHVHCPNSKHYLGYRHYSGIYTTRQLASKSNSCFVAFPFWFLSVQCNTTRGHFDGERVEKPFPLLKRWRTHYGRHGEPFSGKRCTRLQDFAHTISKNFLVVIPSAPKRSRCLDPDTDFRLSRQCSHWFRFTKRPLILRRCLSLSSSSVRRIFFSQSLGSHPVSDENNTAPKSRFTRFHIHTIHFIYAVLLVSDGKSWLSSLGQNFRGRGLGPGIDFTGLFPITVACGMHCCVRNKQLMIMSLPYDAVVPLTGLLPERRSRRLPLQTLIQNANTLLQNVFIALTKVFSWYLNTLHATAMLRRYYSI